MAKMGHRFIVVAFIILVIICIVQARVEEEEDDDNKKDDVLNLLGYRRMRSGMFPFRGLLQY